MLPQRLFPGWKRVGNDLTSLRFSDKVNVREILDWYSPVTWITGSRLIRDSDMVVLEWWTSSVAHMFLVLLILNIQKKPVLIEFHEVVDPLEYSVVPLRIYARVMGRLIRRMASRYVVHSEHDRHLISSHYHIPLNNIGVIPHGLYDQYQIFEKGDAKRSLKAEGLFVFLFFGLIRPYKGVIHLIHAYENLPEDIRSRSLLLIVGEAWEDKSSLSAALVSPAADRIQLLNRYVSDDEIPTFFSAADVLVLPYTRASQSGVAHIGISYGLPVLASQVGGLAESLSLYEGTRYVQPSDEPGLTVAMEEMFISGSHRYPVPDKLRWETIAETYDDEISEMICKDCS